MKIGCDPGRPEQGASLKEKLDESPWMVGYRAQAGTCRANRAPSDISARAGVLGPDSRHPGSTGDPEASVDCCVRPSTLIC